MTRNLPLKFDPLRKELFVQHLAMGMTPVQAAKEAGFDSKFEQAVTKLMEDEDVQAMIASHKQALRDQYDVSRERVLRNLVDANEMARTQGDPKVMVAANKEIASVMGYQAPQEINVHKRVDVNSPRMYQQLRQVSDEELLLLAKEEGFQSVDLLPAELEGELE